MNLREALKILKIEDYLQNKMKDGTKLAIAGRFEGCKEIAEAIQIVRDYINENR